MSSGDEQPDDPNSSSSFLPTVVYQAQGAVAAEQSIGVEEAPTRMREHAHHHGLALEELAKMIVTGDVVLDSPADGG